LFFGFSFFVSLFPFTFSSLKLIFKEWKENKSAKQKVNLNDKWVPSSLRYRRQFQAMVENQQFATFDVPGSTSKVLYSPCFQIGSGGTSSIYLGIKEGVPTLLSSPHPFISLLSINSR
jgi:hypothetical protein